MLYNPRRKGMMKNREFAYFTAFLISFSLPASAQQALRKPTVDFQRVTSVGNIAMTITNYGTFGDGFAQQRPIDLPSCEYPKGSGIEHLFDGGLWIGARKDNGNLLVTTAAVDASNLNFTVAPGFEFTTSADPKDILLERSSLLDSPFFDPRAISHQDFIADFTDSNLTIPETGDLIPEHTPLKLAVHLETYAWNFPFADAFVIFNYTIHNASLDTLREVYLGVMGDLVVRNVRITPPRVGAPFYQHKGIGKVDSLFMLYVYDYDGDPGFTEDGLYVAMRLLGVTPPEGDTSYRKRSIANAWRFRTNDTPQNDIERYERLKGGIISFEQGLAQNFISLISTGPIAKFAPQQSLNFVFAIVCAGKFGNDPNSKDSFQSKLHLFTNAGWAQRAYDGEDKNGNGILDPGEDLNRNGKIDRYVLPTPPSPPRLRSVVEDKRVTLYWDRSAEFSRDLISGELDFEGYRLYRSQLGADLPGRDLLSSMTLIAEFDSSNGLNYDTGFKAVRLDKPIFFAGDTTAYRYKFVNENLLNGWQYAYAVTAFDRGDPSENLPSLESSRLSTVKRVVPGALAADASAQKAGKKVSVYPNPYRAHATWDGRLERERKMYFFNLPAHCEIRIYTLAGDLVDTIQHESQSYTGLDTRWFSVYAGENVQFSGGEHAWDLVTADDQAIATGLYLYTVEDLATGEIQKGKFAVIK
jgi:hypothetical protein